MITLKEDYLYWLYVDCEQVEHIELFKLHEIEKSFRSFTVSRNRQLGFHEKGGVADVQECDTLGG